MTRPNFFIVGAPKCGTSSMWRYLDAHPEIFMSQWKEPHFFSRFDLPWTGAGWGVDKEHDYLRLFSAAASEPRVGEASTWYLYSTEAHWRIAEFAPEAKIICMLRDPVAMVCSMFHQNVSNGNEELFNLAEALDAEHDRVQGYRVPAHAPYAADFFYFRSACYSNQLERYFGTFGRENVLVLLFDDFVKDTASVYERTLSFLGVTTQFRPQFDVVNSKRPIRNHAIRRFLLARPRLAAAVDRYASPKLRGAVGTALAALVPQRKIKPIISPQTAAQLRARFVPEVTALQKLLNRDLSSWGARST